MSIKHGRNNLFRVILLLLIIGIIISCTREISLTLLISDMPRSLDGVTNRSVIGQLILNNLAETVLIEGDMRYYENLVNSFYWIDDYTLKLSLRDDVRFHDGTLLTAKDIIASLDNTNNIQYNIPINTVSYDSKQLTLRTENPVILLNMLSQVPISKAENLINKEIEWLQRNPIFTGRYYLSYFGDDKIVLRKNSYHRNNTRRSLSPSIVEILLIPSSIAQYQIMLDGEADLMLNLHIGAFQDISHIPHLTFLSRSHDVVIKIVLDASRENSPGINIHPNPLLDRNVRRAIAHAIDVDRYVNDVLFGQGVQKRIPIINNFISYPHDLDFYRFDLEYAKYLMAKAGHTDGFEMTIYNFSSALRTLDFIKANLSKINISVNFETIVPSYWAVARNYPQAAGLLMGTFPSRETKLFPSLGRFFYYDQENIHGNSVLNHFGNYHPEINKIIQELGTTYTYTERVFELYRMFVEIIHDEVFIIPLFSPNSVVVVNNRFKFVGNCLLFPRFTNFNLRR